MKVGNGKKTIGIEYANGKKDVLEFDTHNADNLQAWTDKAKSLQEVDFTKLEDIDGAVAIMADIYISVFGKRSFRKFWRKTNKDLEALALVISETSRLLGEAMTSFRKLGK